jgi:hypothetical protein
MSPTGGKEFASGGGSGQNAAMRADSSFTRGADGSTPKPGDAANKSVSSDKAPDKRSSEKKEEGYASVAEVEEEIHEMDHNENLEEDED